MSLPLYVIEESLELLANARELAESEGDSEAINVIDAEIEKYLTREVAKVDSYAALIRRRDNEAALCREEAQRLIDRAKAAENDVGRLKRTALAVMERFGVKELRTPTNTLRAQNNGGLQPLDIPIAEAVPEKFRTITITLPLPEAAKIPQSILSSATHQQMGTDTGAIRAALKQRVPCPECGGVGVIECKSCNGAGTVPTIIPGAKLLPWGKHLSVE